MFVIVFVRICNRGKTTLIWVIIGRWIGCSVWAGCGMSLLTSSYTACHSSLYYLYKGLFCLLLRCLTLKEYHVSVFCNRMDSDIVIIYAHIKAKGLADLNRWALPNYLWQFEWMWPTADCKPDSWHVSVNKLWRQMAITSHCKRPTLLEDCCGYSTCETNLHDVTHCTPPYPFNF